MSGYIDFSISTRGAEAYRNGLLPASKMVAFLKKRWRNTFKSLTVAVFREFITASEWHHTSCKYNTTDFFSLEDVFENRQELKASLAKIQREKQIAKQLKKLGIEKVIYNGEYETVSSLIGSYWGCDFLEGILKNKKEVQ